MARDGVGLRLDPLEGCLSLFPWGQFRRQSGVKLDTLRDVRGSIPARVDGTGGQVHDVKLRDELRLKPGAFSLLDRGEVDCACLSVLT